ncbi:MAG TPA: GAF domain-containing protein [Candidatus Methylomirabilis sp.]|nr:GAF domain-containing protein [Candidatus Methylomirabilis sp.]
MMGAENLEARFTALLRASQVVGSSLDLDDVLEAIVQQAAEISATPMVRLFLLDEDTKLLRCRVSVGLAKEEERDLVLAVGEGFSGQVAATGQPLAVSDCGGDPRLGDSEHVSRWGLSSYLGLPVRVGDRVMGVLVFNTKTPRDYTGDEIAYLSTFASDAAIAIENARLHAAAVHRGAELEALLRATRSVMSGLDLSGILQRIVAEASRMAGAPHVAVLLLDGGAQVLRVAALAGNPVPPGFEIPLGTDLSGVVAQTGESVFSPNSSTDPRNLLADRDRDIGLVTYLGLPIKGREGILGVLTFETTTPRHYTEDELAYLTSFADNAAMAIENARLYRTVQEQAAGLEARVQERTTALEEALRAKAEFLARMSHELRTPLNFILGFADLLHQGIGGALTAKQVQFVDRIRTGGKHLLDLVHDILELSLVEGGKRGLRLERIPLAPLVQEVLDIFSIQALQKRLCVVTSLEPGLCIVVDRRRLLQVLSNLLGNAIKFTPDGGTITLTARHVKAPRSRQVDAPRHVAPSTIRPDDTGDDRIEIAVKDTGIGIRAADIERIFRGFEQVDGSTSRRFGGAGIGLSLVRTLVELHGGQVWAESAGPGTGTRFVVHLPLLPEPSPKRIVVVEDDAATAEALAALLRNEGYGVEGAATGMEGLAAILANPPDLALLDIGLPDMDGREVLKRLRAGERTHSLPVLVLTGLGEDLGEGALALGADEFLTKPISASVLTRIVGEILRGGVPKPQDVFPVPTHDEPGHEDGGTG